MSSPCLFQFCCRYNPQRLEHQLTMSKASCKQGVADFNSAAECVSNSTFLANCGACQTCIQTYVIENPDTPDAALLLEDVAKVISLCADSPASEQVQALESQASRISVLASRLATASASPTSSHAITAAPTSTSLSPATATGTYSRGISDSDGESWSSVLATASWASDYYSQISQGQNQSMI